MLRDQLKVYEAPRVQEKKKTMMDLFKGSKSNEQKSIKRNPRISKYEQLTDVCDFVDQKLGGFLNFTKESLERCEVLSKKAYMDSNLYTLLVFWMTKFMEFFATVIFEALNMKIERAIKEGKEGSKKEGSSKNIKGKFEWNLFKKKPKKDLKIKVTPFLSPDTVELFRSIYMLIFRFNAKNQKFMEKIRASNYFSECDQIRGKIFDMLKGKSLHLMTSIFNEISQKIVTRFQNPEFLKTEKKPRMVEQFLLFLGKFYREINLLVNADLIRDFKLGMFLSVHKGIQESFLNIPKQLFKKVRSVQMDNFRSALQLRKWT
jgi:hypothetical protein